MKNNISKSFVPNNVQPSVFVTYVYDNCDHNPETLSGVSMHCTNGIMIQKSHNQLQPRVVNGPAENRIKRRSFVAAEIEMEPCYSPAEKPNPLLIKNIETETKAIHELHSKKMTFLWLLLRYIFTKPPCSI